MSEKRTELRLLCADLVQILWRDEAGSVRKATAVLEDISQSGACLQLEDAVPVSCEVRIGTARAGMSGRVCYCFFHDIGFSVGVQFAGGSKWTRRKYCPQHLLDPRSVIESSASGQT